MPPKTRPVLDLVPLGPVDPNILREVKKAISHYLPLPVRILDPKPLPDHTYHLMRQQYHSTGLLEYLLEEDPDDSFRILAFTSVDLYIPIFTFVFGEAQLDGKAAIISLFRPGGWDSGLRPSHKTLIQRLTKLGLHELGHTFGLGHCRQPHCLMAFSPNLEKLDQKNLEFCSYCQVLLKDFFNGLEGP